MSSLSPGPVGVPAASHVAMNTRPIRFFHRGRVVEVGDAAPTRSVLDWLREDARCTGTKEGCNEGDCGACTVVIGELAEPGDAAARCAACRCRRSTPASSSCPRWTARRCSRVEDLKAIARDGALHPAQQAMVDCHGSQCGFCTPGFVMSMWSGYEQHRAAGTQPTRQAAGRRAVGQPVPLHRLPADPRRRAAHVRAAGGARSTPRRWSRRCSALALGRDRSHYERGARFHAPRRWTSWPTLRERSPQARLLAGSHRRRPVGQQAVPRAGRHPLPRRGRRN